MSASITLVQSNKSISSNTISFTSPNTAKNLGIVGLGVGAGTVGGFKDSNCNYWQLLTNFNTNIGNVALWVCYSLNAGSNTIDFGSSLATFPSLFVQEWNISGATNYGALAQEQPFDVNYLPIAFASALIIPASAFVHTLISLIYDNTTAHNWSVTPGTLDQETQEPGGRTAAIAYNTVTTRDNSMTFSETSVTSGFPNTLICGAALWAI